MYLLSQISCNYVNLGIPKQITTLKKYSIQPVI
jgi:hypothetical protein